MSLKNGSTAIFANSYGYSSATGRMATVGDGTYTAHYTWQDGTGLMAQNQIKRDSDSSVITTHNRTYGSRLSNYNLLSVSNTTGAATRAYSYVYNTKDQRTRMTLPDGAYWEYAYDDKGQVISGVKKDAAGNVIPGQSYGYNYDGIGNRNTTKHGMFGNQDTDAITQTYTSNSVNQYTQITTPGIAPVVGEADTDTKVKVIRNDSNAAASGEQVITTDRDGVYFMGMFKNVDNSNSAQTIPYTVYAIKTDYNNNKQFVQKASSSYTVPKRTQAYTYDNDGNMTSDGAGWNYTWNGENRMVQAVKTDDTKIEFKYDFMGRRFEKKKYSWNSSAWQLDTTEKYVWNGYNIVAIYNASDVLQKSMLYGLDINGGLQSAGGVGGLLLVNDAVNSKTYLPVYDGNGNVRVYLDSADGTKVAEYDYSPDTNFTIKTGTKADELATIASFSTKPYDKDLDAFLYELRITRLGRWLSRDPIGENGGVNRYGFVSNNTVSNKDYLGMFYINLARRISLYGMKKAQAISDKHGYSWASGYLEYLIRLNEEALDRNPTSIALGLVNSTAGHYMIARETGSRKLGASCYAVAMTISPLTGFAEGWDGISYQAGNFGIAIDGFSRAGRFSSSLGQTITWGFGAYGATRFMAPSISKMAPPKFGPLLNRTLKVQKFKVTLKLFRKKTNKTIVEELEGGGTWFLTEKQYYEFIAGRNIVGRADGQFMISSKAANQIIHKAGGSTSKIAKSLGTEWTSGQKLMRVDVTNPLKYNVRLPKSGMSGANTKFIPGGKTSGKIPEVVTDPLPITEIWITPVKPGK